MTMRRRSWRAPSTAGRAVRGGRSTSAGCASRGATRSHGAPAAGRVRARGSRWGRTLHGDQLVSDIVHYIKGQRCSGIWDRADRAAPRVGDGERRDVHGGWYDASGDYSKYLSHLSYANYMNPQQTPLVVWVLARTWHRLRAIDAPPLLLERIRDEALHGADFLVRMQDPDGFWYVTVFDGWSKDPEQRELCSYRTQLGIKGDDYQAGWRQGGGMAAAALALASTLGDGPDHSADEYLDAALRGFRHLQQHGVEYLDDGRENIIDDTCALLAAAELTAALDDVPRRCRRGAGDAGDRLIDRRRETDGHVWLTADDGERSWFHASDEGLPGGDAAARGRGASGSRRSARALVGDLVSLALRARRFAHQSVRLSAALDRGRRVGATRAVVLPARERVRLLVAGRERAAWHRWRRCSPPRPKRCRTRHGPRRRRPITRLVSWILGRNPFDVCMLQGYGRNNPPYHPGFHNAPGGVCNGITSGFDDEGDIAFRPMPMAADKEHSWRWGEQWMPHGAWLLDALVLGNR